MVIYKYSAPVTFTIFEIEMKEDAQILSVQMQGYTLNPQIWAMVDLKKKNVKRLFRYIATGEIFEFDKGMNHIGTIQLQNGTLILHLFEIKPLFYIDKDIS